jgi:hypothetical protein
MGNSTRRTLLGAIVVGSIAVSCAVVANASPANVIGEGPDWVNVTVENPARNASVLVSAHDVESGRTQLVLDVTGIEAPAGTHLGAHVHTAPCGSTASSSGGHYSDADAEGTLRQREVWLDLHVDGTGRASATATREWAIVDRADRSVVIHAVGTDHHSGAAATRLACTDLDG